MTVRRLRRVVHLDTGNQWRGGQAQVFMLMQGLARRGIENLLLAPIGPLLSRARSAGIETRRWAPWNDLSIGAALRASWEIRIFGADLVHCHSARAHALGVPAARLAFGTAVVVSRRVAVPVRRGLKYRMPVDLYLCVSEGVRAAMERGGVPRDRLVVVPSGIESPRSSPLDLRKLIDVPERTALIGTVAALTAEKRHQDLLEALRLVHAAGVDADLVLFGEGPRRAALEAQRDRLGLVRRVHFLGFRDDASALVAQCTIAALASESEGIATSLIEAEAAGVPVVATAVGGVPEVVRDGLTGRLVPPADPRALADALVELLADPGRRAAMAEAARHAAAEFHIDRTVQRTMEAYRLVLEGRLSAA